MTPPNETNDAAVARALERLDQHENDRRKNWRWLVLAITTALGGAGGTGVKAFVDSDGFDQLREVVARHVVESDGRLKQAEKERERLIEQVGALRETVAGLRATVKILAGHRRETREAIDAVPVPPRFDVPEKAEPAPPPASQAVQEAKKDLFGE